MNENEFDQKIRESALAYESRTEKPLWNKKGTWNRIESGLEQRNRTNWWKVAAILFLFLSFGWSYAQWIDFRKLRNENEMKLIELQTRLQLCDENKDIQEDVNRLIISKQKSEIDSLKAQINQKGEIGQKQTLSKQVVVKSKTAEKIVLPNDQKNLIDSLQILLQQALKQNSENQTASDSKADNAMNAKNPKLPAVSSPENQIYYVSPQTGPKNMKKEISFRIGIFGLSREENIEYKSDHSIFKK